MCESSGVYLFGLFASVICYLCPYISVLRLLSHYKVSLEFLLNP